MKRHRTMPDASITNTDRRTPMPIMPTPYASMTSLSVSASSGNPSALRRANSSWLARFCGLIPQTTASRSLNCASSDV